MKNRPPRGTDAPQVTASVRDLCERVLSLEVTVQPSGALVARDPDTGRRMLVVVTELAEGEV